MEFTKENIEIIDNYVIYKDVLLGQGSFAKVYMGYNRSQNFSCAVKISKENCSEDALNELEVMRQIKSPHVVQLYHYKVENGRVYLFLEKMDASLQDHLNTRGRFSEAESLLYFEKMLSGVADLHNSNFMHRDLKLDNVFCNGNDIKIGDFNLSTDKMMTKSVLGTPDTMSPEMFMIAGGLTNQKNYSKSIDLWSLGVILYTMVYGKPPYKLKVSELNKKMVEGVMEIFKNKTGRNLEFPKTVAITIETKKLLAYILDWENSCKLNIARIRNSACLDRFRKSTLDITMRRKKSTMAASTFMTNSVLVDTKFSSQTASLKDRILLENIDRVIQNHKQRNYNLSLIVNLIQDTLQYLSLTTTTITKKQASEDIQLSQDLQMCGIVMQSKLYFMERKIYSAGNDLSAMNQLVAECPHILEGKVETSQWNNMHKLGEPMFREFIKEHNSNKNRLQADVTYAIKKYRELNPQDSKIDKIMMSLKNKDEATLDTVFEKLSYKGAIAAMERLEVTQDPKMIGNCKDIACLVEYFLRYNAQDGIDWFRYQHKVENLPRQKRDQVFTRLRGYSSGGSSWGVATWLLVLLIAALLVGGSLAAFAHISSK